MQNLIRKVGQGNAMHMAGTRCFLPIEACLEIIFFAQVYETKKIQLQAFLCKFLSDSFYCIDVYIFNFIRSSTLLVYFLINLSSAGTVKEMIWVKMITENVRSKRMHLVIISVSLNTTSSRWEVIFEYQFIIHLTFFT